jgi:hypothetical protein
VLKHRSYVSLADSLLCHDRCSTELCESTSIRSSNLCGMIWSIYSCTAEWRARPKKFGITLTLSAIPPDGGDSGDHIVPPAVCSDHQLFLDGDMLKTLIGEATQPTTRMVLPIRSCETIAIYDTSLKPHPSRWQTKSSPPCRPTISETKSFAFHHRRDSKTNRPSSQSRD